MKRKNVILTMLVILGMVTFLDRINISVAGSSIMHDLNLSPAEWGWVQSAFILSYGLMQIPMGALGDRLGHRKILAAIVLWWSLFTAFTGLAGGLASLLVIRFMFGIGEAGSSPCSTGVISRWFEKDEVGKAQGYVWAASRMGGALTPFVVIPVMMTVGWRAAFYLLGALGIVWAVVWYFYYRDAQTGPAHKVEELKDGMQEGIWKDVLRNSQFWLICGMYFFYAFGSWFFFSWFPTFMELGRGFDKAELTYAVAVPFVMSMMGNIAGGHLTDRLTQRYGVKVGRKALGASSLAVSAVCSGCLHTGQDGRVCVPLALLRHLRPHAALCVGPVYRSGQAACRHHQRCHEYGGQHRRVLLWHPVWRTGAAVGRLQSAALHDCCHAHRECRAVRLYQSGETNHQGMKN